MPSTTTTLAGGAAIALAAALWAVAAVVAADLFADGVSPVHLVEARAFITAAGLALAASAWRRPAPGTGRPGVVVALGAALALVNASYYTAIDHLPVAIAIVLQYTAPVLVVTYIAASRRTRPAPEIVAALAAAVAGVVLVSEVPGGDLGRIDLFGFAMGLVSALMFAAYTLLAERAGPVYGPAGTMMRAFAVASAIWLVFQAPQGVPDALFAASNIGRVLFVGLFGTLAPFVLFVWGVERIRAERAAIVATLEPVVAAIAAWVWLGQRLTPLQVAGGGLVVAAVGAVQGRSRHPVPPEPGAPVASDPAASERGEVR